ncbi:MAG TPA: pilin [Candidatus Gracilibacteria bacterium]|nr:pilin [Candidatus Gracilibacteria bacterium]
MVQAVKKILTIISTFTLLFAVTPLAYADYTCSILNDPNEAKKEGVIVSMIEEQFGGASGDTADTGPGDSTVMDCFRVTTCEETTKDIEGSETQQKITSCTSTYESSCSPNTAGGVTCQKVQVFVAKSGTALLFSYIGTIYRWAAGVIGVVTVLYLIWGGVEIATAGDNTGKIDEAKQKIIQSIGGLVLLFLSAVILYTINPNFFTL